MGTKEYMEEQLGRELDSDDKEVLEITLEFNEANRRIINFA